MKKTDLETYLSEFPGAESSYPFGPEALVFKVMDKMYALVSQNEETPRVTLKCEPTYGEELITQFDSITPGYYMNKKHWITLSLTGEVEAELIKSLSSNSYQMIVSKFKKSEREQLQDR
ncbi:MmcQ/YjbR family DNA-binding protein [Desulfoluna sp.]|uniref:MmcQ/YjbR family DNA-binding protein n=1 Tax=Desulfoluna sp. TaxID=2045199 RepID=UPI00261F3F11|nr:MmcQ/YjbR family DNA-binding protein [Desulfoluna sp.]